MSNFKTAFLLIRHAIKLLSDTHIGSTNDQPVEFIYRLQCLSTSCIHYIYNMFQPTYMGIIRW